MKRYVGLAIVTLFVVIALLVNPSEPTVTGQAVHVPLDVSQEDILQTDNVQELFIILDTDNNGELSKKEFEQGMNIMLN